VPRKADLLFLKLAVKNEILSQDLARSVVDELEQSEKTGKVTKARYVCVERKLMDDKTAKTLKRSVKDYLEKKAEDSTTGRRIGNYTVEAKLGAGAMGIVYRAKHVKLGRIVALKLLLPEFAQDDIYVERFEREARAAAALNHPNVVQCFDAGTEDDVVYIAMEFVNGKTAKELMEEGQLPEQQAVKIAIQVARALEHAAGAGLIHRDVKPANVMIDDKGVAKLLDLGLAKKIERDDQSDLTEAGRAIGTPYYMAPEQALDGVVDHRADIYALGCTLYAMLTGEPPYKAATPTGVLAKHVKDPIPSVRAKAPKCSTGVEKVIERMLAKQPEQRYQKHQTLIQDLEAVLSGFMPELKEEAVAAAPRGATGRSGAGKLDAGRRRGGSGARTPSGATNQSGVLVGVGAIAAAAVAAILLTSHKAPAATVAAPQVATSQPGGNAGNNNGTNPGKPEESPLEEATRRQLDEALHSGKTGWELFARIDNVARHGMGTKAGNDAHDEACRLSGKLEDQETQEFNVASKGFEALYQDGNLLAAADGYQGLVEKFHGERAAKLARERAAAIDARAQELISAADTKASRHIAEGREDLAAEALRSTVALRRGPSKKTAETRADELAKTFVAKVVQGQRETQAREQVALRSLETELRLLVRARKYARALENAQATLDGLLLDASKAKATALKDNMIELATLQALSAKAFTTLRGQLVHVERRGGAATDGRIKSSNETSVSIEVAKGATIPLSFDEIDEVALLNYIRRSQACEEAERVRLLALVKIYRGDEDSAAAAAAANDAALVDLAKEMGTVEVVARNDPATPKPPTPSANVKPDAPPATPTPNAPPPGSRGEKDQLIYDNRLKLFPGATEVGYYENAPAPWYNFQIAGRNFGNLWKVEAGQAMPTPAGQLDRSGLQLRSADGRVTFDVPLTGNVTMKTRFMSFGSIRDDSRFALTIDDQKKKDHFEACWGVLHYEGKGHKPRDVRAPDDLATRISANTLHTLELTYSTEGTVTARLDDQDMGQIDAVGIAELKVGVAWENVNLAVLSIEVHGVPTDDYIKKAIDTKKGK
jgi:serine/threonine-protein kinase